MLREGLLRSKQDEIARCLLSRKRKLSELYFATVGYATETNFADSAYHEQEQAFLDANDITKGRYFNEATLPALPSYAAPPVRETKATPLAAPTPTPAASNAVPPSPSSRKEARASEASNVASQPGSQKATAPQATEKQPSESDTEQIDSKGVSRPAPDTPLGAPQRTDGSTPDAKHGAPTSQAVEKAASPAPGTPRSTQHSSVTIAPTDRKDAPTAQPVASSPKSQHDAPHPVHPEHPAQVAEQPLSPVSSAGPLSNNTPAATAASPATSAAEEPAESVVKVPSPKGTATVQEQSSFVPSTPDEQLRFEEAQSLQQNALLSNQVDDGAGAGPLANQVIQEDLPSTSTPKNLERETAASAPEDILPISKQPDSTPVEPKAPEQRSPVQASSQAETVDEDVFAANEQVKKASPSAQTGPPTERMTTRVSSGAIRHKSVSEILGEAPKTPVSPVEKSSSTERSAELERPDVEESAKLRLKDRRAREKERNRLSTVVFPKQQQQDKSDDLDLVRQQSSDMVRLNEEQDYLYTLFQNKAYNPPRGMTLQALLSSAHKTLSTGNYLLEYQEQMDCRILRRIYDLQNANRWPLRQLKRPPEPPRQAVHWDILLDHMKWMRTDFREERKWKLAAAKNCADWCAEYVHSDPESRSVLRVQARIPPPKDSQRKAQPQAPAMVSPPDESGNDAMEISHPTPDLVPSTEEDSVSEGFADEPRQDLQDTVAPAAIFSLGSDEFTFSLDMTPAAQKLLDELPMYTPVQIAPNTHLPDFKEPPDTTWKTDILPVSKYARGKITFHEDEPPRKRSRYDYQQYNSGSEHPILDLPPEQTNVALFQPENRAIRDRIHPAQPFRPPTEYPMPSLGFLESRQSSQWTYAEDEELRSLVEEYSYNWSLISSCLTPSSQYTSGAERRTPWECFERWAGIEGLPSDMSKTPYFRAYHQRIDTAQRNVMAQQQAAAQQQQQQQQQQANNGTAQPPMPLIRRRGTQPIRVDRRRSSKHLALLDAMRKLAKKRETMLQKQQQASQLASLRKVNEANQPKPPISSPAEFSRLKHERELKLQERQEQYRQQMIAQQRASLVARAGQMPNQQQMMNAPGRPPSSVPQNQNPSAPAANAPNGLPNGVPNGIPNGIPNGVPQGVGVNQARPHVQGMQGSGGPVNSQMTSNPMAMKVMPQSGMQQNTGNRPNMQMQGSPDNARVIREVNRLQEQQRVLQSRQQQPPQHPLQQQQPPQSQNQQQQVPQQAQQQFHNQPQFVPQGSNSPNLNMASVNGAPNNPAMMAALQAGGGMQSPPFHNTTPQGVSTPSPRMGQPNLLSSGVVPTISNLQSQIQRSNPNMSMEQVNKIATDRLHQYQQQRMSQVAMNAAAGNLGVQPNYQVQHDGNFQTPPTGMNGGPNMQVPQAQGFSPMMRVPQPAQQNRVGTGSSPGMGVAVPQQSRSATPQTQRSGSAQTGQVPGTNKSPNNPQSQSMGS